jgi:hypothetical protein
MIDSNDDCDGNKSHKSCDFYHQNLTSESE